MKSNLVQNTLHLRGDPMVRDRLNFIKKFLPAYRMQNCKLLDIGFGNGAFIKIALERGYEFYGITHDKKMIDFVNTNFTSEEINLIKIDLNSNVPILKDLVESSNVILMLEVLEHLENDLKFLETVVDSMQPDSLLFLTVPNLFYSAVTEDDNGPFPDPDRPYWHKRRGYTIKGIEKMLNNKGSIVYTTDLSPVSSQRCLAIYRYLCKFNKYLGIFGALISIVPLKIYSKIVSDEKSKVSYSLGIIFQK